MHHNSGGCIKTFSKAFRNWGVIFAALARQGIGYCDDYAYTTNGASITIVGYTGGGGALEIPSAINGLPVVRIGSRDDGGFELVGAFHGITNITSITIPNSIETIDPQPFSECINLTAITVDPLNPLFTSLDGVLYDKGQTTLVAFPGGKSGTYSIPDTLTNLPQSAFQSCHALGKVVGGSSLTTIPDSAFQGCTNLNEVRVPGNVTLIEPNAFKGCGSLTNLVLGRKVVAIANNAFWGCAALTKVIFPKSVIYLYSGAFQACPNLRSVYCEGDAFLYTFDESPFDGPNQLRSIYYLPGTIGWGATYFSTPTTLWNPQVQKSGPGFGPTSNGFSLPITGSPNIPILIEAATAPTGSVWTPLHSCTLTNGSIVFGDTDWKVYPERYYRIRSP